MNKLAVIAGIVLLILGGAQWYVASNSLTPYVNKQLALIEQQLENQKLHVDGIAIATHSGTASVTRFNMKPVNSASKTPALSIEDIVFTLNPKSIKKEIIAIDNITISQLTLHLDNQLTAEDTQKMIDSFTQILKNNALQNSLIDGYESRVTLEHLMIKQLSIIYFHNGVPTEESIFIDQKIEGINTESDLPVSVLMTQVLQKIVTSILTNQLSEPIRLTEYE